MFSAQREQSLSTSLMNSLLIKDQMLSCHNLKQKILNQHMKLRALNQYSQTMNKEYETWLSIMKTILTYKYIVQVDSLRALEKWKKGVEQKFI